MKENIVFVSLALFLLAAGLQAQPISLGEKKILKSNILNESRTYFVSLPDNYQQASTLRYPVLYVLDGDEYFQLAASTVRYLANRGFIPQTIVVGVDNSANRDRDLTPTADQYSPEGGGAKTFLSFLKGEMMPAIDRAYRTVGYNTLYGASYGGLFSLYTLYNEPDVFAAYIAVSPSLFHDNGLVFKQGLEFFFKGKANPKFVFLSLADESFTEMRLTFNNTVQLFKNQAEERNIRWSVRYYADETHETTKLKGLNDGLRTLHEFWYTPFYKRDNGLQGLLEHARLVSKTYGYEVYAQEGVVNRLAYQAMKKGDLKMARELLNYNVSHYPNSPNVFDSMGEYFELTKQVDSAKVSYQRAIQLSTEQRIDVTMWKEKLKKLETGK